MHKIFLVEDEIVVRETIRDNIEWEKTPFVFSGEASDGEMAIPLIEEIKPDILITDIRMPFMDGLQLSRLVKKSMPWIKILILSGHEEFSFAKEAISIPVTDYLLKPISAADLLEALERIAGQIAEEAREREHSLHMSRCLRDNRQMMSERFLNDLTTGIISSAEAIEKAGQLGLSIVSRHYLVILIEAVIRTGQDSRTDYPEYVKAENLLRLLIEGDPDIISFDRNLKETVLIVKGERSEDLESRGHQICRSLKYEVERKTSCMLRASIGSVKERITGIAESFADAEAARKFDYIFGNDAIISIGDTERANLGTRGLMRGNGNAVVECLRIGERDQIEQVVDEFLRNALQQPSGRFQFAYQVIDLILATAKFIEELGGEAAELLPGMRKVEREIAGNADPGKLRRLLLEIFGSAFDFRENRKADKYGDIIARAKAFIGEHFADHDISLNSVARSVGVSPSHFSTIFSHASGQTFIEYLTSARIRHAMELLKTTTLRSSEIAYRVGYGDPHYFSYIFKKHTGRTPSEHRRGTNGAEPQKQ